MIEKFEDAEEELKRADHLVFVTLKYTRTVDVIKNAIQRLISAFDIIILQTLEYAKRKRKLREIPGNPVARREALKKIIKNKEINNFMKVYDLMKVIDRAQYIGRNEYRKNISLIALVDGKQIDVNVDKLRSFFDASKGFLMFIYEWISSK